MTKKIVITGATGLVGSSLIQSLLNESEYEIYIVGRSTRPQWNTGRVHFIEADFATDWDESGLPDAPEAVVHLSQSEDFRHFPGKAKNIFYVNTLTTLKLINYACAQKARHFIYASSGGVYGNGPLPFKEEDPVAYKKETGFYIASKHCSEVILQNYFNLLHVILLRFFFVYGKEQKQDMLIPRLVNNVKNGEPISLQGTEGIRINPVYVDDAAAAIRAALQLNESTVINVAGPEILSLKQIGSLIGGAAGLEPQFISDVNQKPADLTADIAKMRQLLFDPKNIFSKAIKTLL